MPLPLTEKYRATSFQEIKGQDLAIQEITNFYKQFPASKAIILNGPVGTGKTSIAIALANEFNLELFELNASDLRNRLKLEETLKPATTQQSLFKKGKLILMDEADGITASDRGGLPELITLIEKSKHPIIITANDIWQKKFSPLRKKCKLIDLKELTPEITLQLLQNILEKENHQIKIKTLNSITKKARGDIRAALNDLQTIFTLGEESFLSETHEREKQESVFDALKHIFQEPTTPKTIRVFDNTPLDLNEALLWIEENIPNEYQGQALAFAFNYLSKADLFKGRIYRQQFWRFLVYQNFFLTAGISSSTKLKNKKFISYKRPTRILKIWLSNLKNAKKKSIIVKYSQITHMSKKKAMKESFLFPLILNNLDEKTKTKLDLDEKEQQWLQEKQGAIIIANNLNRFR